MPAAATVEDVEIYDSGIVTASLLLCSSHILARHAPHIRGEPGAKSFVDELLLGRGFVRSRAAPSLRSIESQPSTQGFVFWFFCVFFFFFWTSLVAQMVKRLSTMWETWVRSLGRKIPWRRKWQPTPILLPRKSQGRRSLVQEKPGAGYCPWGRKESDTTERLHFHFI